MQPESIQFDIARTTADLSGILALQQANLSPALSPDEIRDQGFVTAQHDLAILSRMHAIEPSVVARHDDRIVGYILAMTAASRHELPILYPMFEMFDHIRYNDKPVAGYRYMVVGQVCVDKEYRGQGLFEEMYAFYIDRFRHYDFIITEIALRNGRSIRAHEKIGFKTIHRYTEPDGEAWQVVLFAPRTDANHRPH